MLDNIVVNDSDLQKFAPNILDVKFPEQVDFSNQILEAKRAVYSALKQDYIANYRISDDLYIYAQYGTNDSVDTTLNDVKDYAQEKYLYHKIVYLTLASIYRQAQMYDAMGVWENEALKVPIKYYVDTDKSGTADLTEEVTGRKYGTFHR